MKVVLAGAYGKLGAEILKKLYKDGHEIVAADMIEKDIEGIDKEKIAFRKIDVTNTDTLKGLCEGADVVISTVGLTTSSATTTNFAIDYQGNVNLLNEAKASGVKHFVYISVIHADEGKGIPMVEAKYMFEQELEKSGLSYVIHRPTGYFYDIVKVFKPMIEKGSVSLLGKKPVSANVVHTTDFAEFIVDTMLEENKLYNVGGKETYTYEEIANMCFEAAGKTPVIKRAPAWLFSVLANLPKNKKNGKWAVIKFGRFTMTKSMVGDTTIGESSFSQYIKDSFKKD
ncbi:MAG: SDR family oxidoreductase [Bacilli bacterium]|nr:SDR family oxidoreductase [Bacilli bacterium]